MENSKEVNSKNVKLLLLYFSIAFIVIGIIGGIYTGTLSDMVPGFVRIITSPAQLTRDYFKLGGIAGCFLNVGLSGLLGVALAYIFGTVANGATIAGFFLVTGFAFFGLNFLNIIPCMLGVLVYGMVTKKKLGTVVNLCMFSTALSPFISEVLFRYPATGSDEIMGASLVPTGIVLAIVLGLLIGFFMPPLCAHAQNYHKGYDLYNAGPAAGFLACVFVGLLWKLTGIAKPGNTFVGSGTFTNAAGVEVSYDMFIIVTFAIMFIIPLVIGFVSNGDYGKVLADAGHKSDFVDNYGFSAVCKNLGFYGLFLLAFYSILHFCFGAKFTGPTVGAIICAYTFVGAGAHPKNVWPIAAGYVIAGLLATMVFQPMLGLEKAGLTLATQAIVVGFAFSTGMAPISGKHGFIWGIIAGIIHFSIVTILPDLHWGFNLYNGGLTSGVVAFVLIPFIEQYWPDKAEAK